MKYPLFVHCLSALVTGSFTLSSANADEPFVEQVEVLEIQFDPVGQLLNPGDGFFYGAASWSDTARGGVIYRFAPGQNAEVLYTFESLVDAGPNIGGSNPCSPLIIGPDGAFYGVTRHGGSNAHGTVYRLSQDGIYSVLHHCNATTEGTDIYSLISTPQGDLFGQTGLGGPQGGGTLFRLGLDGVYQIVYSFPSPPSVMEPGFPAVLPPSDPGQLAVGADGKIYGTTRLGGPAEVVNFSDRPVDDPIGPVMKMVHCYGSFFRYDGPNAITELGHFDPFKEKSGPLTAAADGFYTTTGNQGSQLLHITLDGTITRKTDFKQLVGGRLVVSAPLILDGKVFGVSYYSGTNDAGFIYRYTPGGETEIIHHFAEEFAERRKWIVEGNDGMIYGLAALPQASITAAEQERIANSGKSKKKQPRRNPDDLPRAFRYRETPGTANFVPAARPDVAWLPAKAGKNGSREIIIDVLANDADADKDALVIESVESSDASGSASIVSTAKGQAIRFTTTDSDPASSLFTYRVSDGKGGESIGQLAVKAPLTGSFTGTVNGNTPVTVTVGKKNTVTASAVINGKKLTGKGSLDVDDSADLTLKAKGQPAVSLHLGIERDGSRKVSATLVKGDAAYQGSFTPKGKK